MTPPTPRRTAIVLGSATGIGAAGARRLAADGWRLGLLDVQEEPLAALAAELDCAHAVADAADAHALEIALGAMLDELGRLDAAWSNVGVQVGGDIERASVADLDRSYALNVRAHYVVARGTIPALRAGGGGSLLITASNSGLQTEPQLVPYVTTKAAAVGLVRTLARDHARDRIRVNALCPGYVDTPFNAPIWSNFGGREAFLREVPSLIPLGRMATAQEIAGIVSFLLGDEAAYVTGQAIVADGGELVA
jgi:NAD(P)-dependent dehydrogenase (short-subunit alcohol dehydrogenase family)